MNEISKFGVPQNMDVDKIDYSQFQMRVNYGNIDELAANIKKLGLLEPILVRPYNDRYEVVHGHRRLEAVKKLGWKTIRAFIKTLPDLEAIEIQGSENIHRKDYDPIEEARLYSNYQEVYSKEKGEKTSLRNLEKIFKKSYQHINERIKLLELPEDTQEKIAEGKISVSKANQLTRISDVSDADKIVEAVTDDEKGDSYLRTEKGVSKAVSLVQEGVPVDEAIKEAKKEEVVREVSQMQQRGISLDEIVSRIKMSKLDLGDILRDTRLVTLKAVEIDFKNKGIVCPDCGEICLEWHCTHTKLIKDG